MKLCVIGAGSSYTPELIEGVIRNQPVLPISTVTLMDIDADRLRIVADLARRMVQAAAVDIKIEETLERKPAIEGSRFVISQIRVGGMAARILDETIPPPFGVIGQETTGPGGFAKALRTIPVALDIAREIESLAPEAFLINFTNPAGLITEALQRHSGVKSIGLCNLPIGMEMRIAREFNVERKRIRLDWVGLNHLNWTRGAYLDDEDIWPQVYTTALELAREETSDGWNFSADVLETLGMIPCGYLNYYYNHEYMLEKQRSAPRSRGEEVRAIEAELMKMYQDPNLNEKPALLEERGGAYYSTAAISLIAAIVNDSGEIHIVNTRNQGAIPEMQHDVVVEVPCRITASGAAPQKCAPMPAEIRGLVQAVKAYEELTVEAAVSGDRRAALQALMTHPLVPSFGVARELLDALIDAHREYLPQFAERK
jgi:6-phospho-beta-glucosidase